MGHMKVLITGANGYIGSRIIPVLIEKGHDVVALVRNAKRLSIPRFLLEKIEIVEGDLLRSLECIPKDIDAAYFLVHSMSSSAGDFSDLEARSAQNFADAISKTSAKQIIYLSGLTRDAQISKHMQSRHNVEKILATSGIPLTVLRAGIIIGAGGSSTEIIRDLVEKLPVMITPKWVQSHCQPIAIRDVLFYLQSVLGKEECYNDTFEIGGPDVLTYKEMMQGFAKFRHLKRAIINVPVLTPRLSSYWLIFVTSTNFALAKALIDSLKTEAISTEHRIKELIPHECVRYQEALQLAFGNIAQNSIVASWEKTEMPLSFDKKIEECIEVPKFGTVSRTVERTFTCTREEILDRLSSREGTLIADRDQGHFLLYKEMQLPPGEGWLDFRVEENKVVQKATFRPRGIFGRFCWFVLRPVHYFIFHSLCRKIAGG